MKRFSIVAFFVLFASILLLIPTPSRPVFGQSGAVVKDPSNKLLTTEYAKWATIDLQPFPGMMGNYGTLRWRIDKIDGFCPFVVKYSNGTYGYCTQVLLSNGTIYYDKRPFDIFGNAMLGYGYGTGVPQQYIYPATQPALPLAKATTKAVQSKVVK